MDVFEDFEKREEGDRNPRYQLFNFPREDPPPLPNDGYSKGGTIGTVKATWSPLNCILLLYLNWFKTITYTILYPAML